jgi:hypothetical protein
VGFVALPGFSLEIGFRQSRMAVLYVRSGCQWFNQSCGFDASRPL